MINIKHIAFKGYKSFADSAVLEDIGNVNLIIGRNNSGKSSVLDILQYVFENDTFLSIRPDEVKITQILPENIIAKCFPKKVNVMFNNGNNINYYDYASRFKDREFSYFIQNETTSSFDKTIAVHCENETKTNSRDEFAKSQFEDAAKLLYSSFRTLSVRKLSAERNIVPEEQQRGRKFNLDPDGTGATATISNYLNDGTIDESVIEVTLLNALNKILDEDANFNAIKVQQIRRTGKETVWEICLSESGKRYALSKMGSGLKTILLVLINLLLSQNKEEHGVFLFEELENNLHPALRRRLFNFIYDFAIKNDVIVFMTTHSHVAINCLFEKEFANIYHIEKTDGKSSIKKIKDYFSKAELLDDLDVRASDLLQSNGIIWVEGPSDRVYIKRWLSLVDSTIKENEHFQFVYYGGKLLSHYTANSNDEKDLLNVLLTNRHSAIVMDSDKRSASAEINETKKRVKNEFDQHGLFSWITQGKEIENYLSCKSLMLSSVPTWSK